jgi:hypothetical protein
MSKSMHHFQETLHLHFVTADTGRNNLEALIYEKFEAVVLEWFKIETSIVYAN